MSRCSRPHAGRRRGAGCGVQGVKGSQGRERRECRPLAAVLAPQIAALAADYAHVFGPSTTFGKDLMPRVAALLGVNQISDIMARGMAYNFRRPVYAGNAIVTVEAPQDTKSSPRCARRPSRPRRRQRRSRRSCARHR